MKRLLLCLGLVMVMAPRVSALEWLTDVDAALARARTEHKAVLLDFTGSDWCGWCKKLKAEVFDNFEFAPYANANLIMVEVDFPRHKSISAAQLAANENLASKYGVEGYPTIILLNSAGQQIGKSGYQAGGPKPYIDHLKSFPGMPDNAAAPAAPAAVAAAAAKPAAPGAAANAPAGAPAQAKTADGIPLVVAEYGDLKLKGISGSPTRRVVLINNETLMQGETAMVKAHNNTVEVTVKEIKDTSVLIVADGKTVELKLGSRPRL